MTKDFIDNFSSKSKEYSFSVHFYTAKGEIGPAMKVG
jgi:hypothetical protein